MAGGAATNSIGWRYKAPATVWRLVFTLLNGRQKLSGCNC